ncbi:MAG: ShlB/FhaC/HecB family hemolysin secretion/activation protein [Bdellovibrionales bacterium]
MKSLRKFALVMAIGLLGAAPAFGQALNAGDISRELEKTLPSLKPSILEKTKEPSATPQQKPFGEKRKKRYIEDPTKELPDRETLGAPIMEIFLFTSVLKEEILNILKDRTFNHINVGIEDLMFVRQKVWNLGIENKKLLHVKFKVVPNPQEDEKSWLIVNVVQIAVRRVMVESDGTVRQSLLNSIQREASRTFYEEKILDLDELDNNIKTRLRLGDVLLRTSVVPVDETHIDLKVYVRSPSEAVSSALIQYDNDGGWAFGRDRLIGGASLHGLLPGDELNLMVMKTADLGNFDYGNGMYFGRAEYQFPFGELGVKLDTWISGLHYHEVRDVVTKTLTNGEAFEFGQGIIQPMFTGKTTMLDLRADFILKYTVDRVLEDVRTSEKAAYIGRIRALLTQALGKDQWLQLTMDVMEGSMDLSGNDGALAQDQAGPKVNGLFTKAEFDGAWLGTIGEDKRTDFRLALKGQWAANNLDSMEKFSLGGASGLRAFGSGEAPGDMGLMVNVDVGHTFENGVRAFALYDAGTIKQNVNSWSGLTGTQSYALHDWGVGISKTVDSMKIGATFAHQIGSNPGASAQGLDVDNTKQHYRIWTSLSYRY